MKHLMELLLKLTGAVAQILAGIRELLQLILAVAVIVALMLITTLVLDLPWIQARFVRIGIIYLVILGELITGLAILHEILRKK